MITRSADDFGGTDRFSIESRLGAGGFGVVYRAYDRERCDVVAVKALRGAESDALYRFKHEFRALADISHPNLVSLYELLSEKDQWFFTMELIEGVNFLDHVRGLRSRGHAASREGTQPFPDPIPAVAPSPHIAERGRVGPLARPGLRAVETRRRPPFRHSIRTFCGPHFGRRSPGSRRSIGPAKSIGTSSHPTSWSRMRAGWSCSTSASSRISLSPDPSGRARSSERPRTCRRSRALPFPCRRRPIGTASASCSSRRSPAACPSAGGFVEMMWDKRHKDAPLPEGARLPARPRI